MSSPPAKGGLPEWAKGLLIGGAIGLVLLACLGGGYYFFYYQPLASAPQPTAIPTEIIAPTPIPPPTAIGEILPSQTPTTAPIPTPTESPTPTTEPQYCDAFSGIKMTVVYLDWKLGIPLELYIKMPGGVPGLEKEIPDASGEWSYRVEIGDYNSSDCNIIAGYRERLYCKITLPEEYESAMQPMSLYANKCETDVYLNQNAFLPEIKK